MPPAPDSTDTERALTDLEAGRRSIARGEMAEALISLRRALRLKPDLIEARTSLGLALYGTGDVEGAMEELDAVLRQRPDAVTARLGLAAALMAKREWTAARTELEEVLAHQPDSLQATYSLGQVRYALGDLEGAIRSYRRVVEQEPEHLDAHYDLALVLKLAGRDAEAAAEFLAAARGGLPRAQYFLGAAYAAGAGVERDLAAAIAWWFRAAEQGVAQAEEALTQLRRTALGRGRQPVAERQAVAQAFQDFRATLWSEFPTLVPDGDETVGGALLRSGRAPEAVPVLIREALALSEPAERLLETVYEHGPNGVDSYDPRILGYFSAAAAEGRLRARLALARIYGRGLGVAPDVDRAIDLLRGSSDEEAKRLLQELSSASTLAPVRQ